MSSQTPAHWSLWFSGYGWVARRQADTNHRTCGWCPQCMASTPHRAPLKKSRRRNGKFELKASTYGIQTGSTEGQSRLTLVLSLYTPHTKCHSVAHALYLASSQPILNVTFGVTVLRAVTHSYLKEALYLVGRNVSFSTQEQRTCAWLGTWQEMLSSPGGSRKQESDRFI